MRTEDYINRLASAFFKQIKFNNVKLNEVSDITLSRKSNDNLWCLINKEMNQKFNYANILNLKSYWTRNANFRERIENMFSSYDGENQIEEKNNSKVCKKVCVEWNDWEKQQIYTSGGTRKKFLAKFDLFLTENFQKNGKNITISKI